MGPSPFSRPPMAAMWWLASQTPLEPKRAISGFLSSVGTAQSSGRRPMGGRAPDAARSIQQTTDGGYVVAGWTTPFEAGEADFWVLKLDGSGNIPECDLIGTSTATVTDTTVTDVDSNVTPSVTGATIRATTIYPADSDASVSTQCYYYAPPTPTPIPVGGVIMPVSKVELLAPWLGLAALMAATVAAVVVRRRA